MLPAVPFAGPTVTCRLPGVQTGSPAATGWAGVVGGGPAGPAEVGPAEAGAVGGAETAGGGVAAGTVRTLAGAGGGRPRPPSPRPQWARRCRRQLERWRQARRLRAPPWLPASGQRTSVPPFSAGGAAAGPLRLRRGLPGADPHQLGRRSGPAGY